MQAAATRNKRQYPAGLFFPTGVNSGVAPSMVPQTSVAYALNTVFRGGIVQVRPGYTLRMFLKCFGENAQMLTSFSTGTGADFLVFAVDGKIWASRLSEDNFHFEEPFQLENLQFSPTAKFLTHCNCTQAYERQSDGTTAPIIPKPVIIFQDGATSRAGYWDGTVNRHLNPEAGYDKPQSGDTIFYPGYNETPLGLWMAWSGNRLWVSNGRKIMASDLLDPTQFTDQIFAAELRSFDIGGTVTGLLDRGIPGVSEAQLLAFTLNSTASFQSGIQIRLDWAGTKDFQRPMFKNVGCVSGRSAIVHEGTSMWFSQRGWVQFDGGKTDNQTQALLPTDRQMEASSTCIGDDLSGIVAVSHESYVLISVPACDVLNRDTWAYDTNVIGPNSFAWCGSWRGTRPVEWVSGFFGGRYRCFHVSQDYDGEPVIWEAFDDSRTDNGHPIKWEVETKLHVPATMFETWLLRNAKAFLDEILGVVDLEMLVRGSRGLYKSFKKARFVATPGSIGLPKNEPMVQGSIISTYAPQTRSVVTEEVIETKDGCGACGIESDIVDFIDCGYSMLLRFCGRAAMLQYRIEMDPQEDSDQGKCDKLEDGTKIMSFCDCTEKSDEPTGLTPESYKFFATNQQNAFRSHTPRHCDMDYVSPKDVAPYCNIQN